VNGLTSPYRHFPCLIAALLLSHPNSSESGSLTPINLNMLFYPYDNTSMEDSFPILDSTSFFMMGEDD